MKIKSNRLTLVEAVEIEIDGFDNLIVSSDTEVVKFNGEHALFLGEFEMYYWVAPFDTLIAEKCCENDFERSDTYITKNELKHWSVS